MLLRHLRLAMSTTPIVGCAMYLRDLVACVPLCQRRPRSQTLMSCSRHGYSPVRLPALERICPCCRSIGESRRMLHLPTVLPRCLSVRRQCAKLACGPHALLRTLVGASSDPTYTAVGNPVSKHRAPAPPVMLTGCVASTFSISTMSWYMLVASPAISVHGILVLWLDP